MLSPIFSAVKVLCRAAGFQKGLIRSWLLTVAYVYTSHSITASSTHEEKKHIHADPPCLTASVHPLVSASFCFWTFLTWPDTSSFNFLEGETAPQRDAFRLEWQEKQLGYSIPALVYESHEEDKVREQSCRITPECSHAGRRRINYFFEKPYYMQKFHRLYEDLR